MPHWIFYLPFEFPDIDLAQFTLHVSRLTVTTAGSAMIETRPNLHRDWDNYNWDWALILLFALVLLVGTILWTYPDRLQTTVIPDNATTGRSIEPSLPTFADRYNGQSD